MTSRNGHSRGRPRSLASGMRGARRAHSASVKSVSITQPIAAMLPPSGRGPHRGSKEVSPTPPNHDRLGYLTDFRDGHLAKEAALDDLALESAAVNWVVRPVLGHN